MLRVHSSLEWVVLVSNLVESSDTLLFIAKNIILAGVKTLAIYDPEKACLKDMTSNFYITEEDMGKPRAEVKFRFLFHLGLSPEAARTQSLC